MTELLENSDNTNESAVVSESPANEATISLAAVQALADALQKIESYTPTVWVDNESPDIDAVHLNKAEQAIMRVTTAMNSAVDVIKDLQSQVNTTNNNLSKYDRKKLNNGDNLNVKLGPYGSASNDIVGSLLNKPTQVVNGEVTIDWYPSNDTSSYGTQILRHTRDSTINIYFRAKRGSVNNWSEWISLVTKDDYACGTATIKADSGTADISFPREFSDIPIVVTTVQGLSKDVLLTSKVYNINKAKFTVTVVLLNNGATVSPPYDITIDWIAMKKS